MGDDDEKERKKAGGRSREELVSRLQIVKKLSHYGTRSYCHLCISKSLYRQDHDPRFIPRTADAFARVRQGSNRSSVPTICRHEGTENILGETSMTDRYMFSLGTCLAIHHLETYTPESLHSHEYRLVNTNQSSPPNSSRLTGLSRGTFSVPAWHTSPRS